jgi:hypothetical protein
MLNLQLTPVQCWDSFNGQTVAFQHQLAAPAALAAAALATLAAAAPAALAAAALAALAAAAPAALAAAALAALAAAAPAALTVPQRDDADR